MSSVFGSWLGAGQPVPGASPSGRGPAPRGLVDWVRRVAGQFLGPRLTPHTPAEKEITSEKAASGPRLVTLPWLLPYPDEYTAETPQARHAYRKMLASPTVKAAVCGKLFGVASQELKIHPADKKNRLDNEIAEFVKWSFTERLTGGVAGMFWDILIGGLVDGYSVCEKVWEYEDKGDHAGKIALDALKPKDTLLDMALLTDEFRNVVGIMGLRYNGGQVFHPSNFVIYKHMPLYGAPVGMSDFRAAYAPWWMLDTVRKLRAIFLEKRALPLLKGTYKNWSQKPSLEQALASAKGANWMAVPEGVLVDALNIAGAAEEVYASAERDLKHDIFLGIQGAILQALEGEVQEGAGDSQVHRSTSDLFRWFLTMSVAALFNDRKNGLIRDMVDLNYVTDRYPRASLSAVDTNELLRDLQIDTGLKQLGLDLSKDELYERYGREPPAKDDPDDALKGGQQQAPGGPGVPSAVGDTGQDVMPEPDAEGLGLPEPPTVGKQSEQGDPRSRLHARLVRLKQGPPAELDWYKALLKEGRRRSGGDLGKGMALADRVFEQAPTPPDADEAPRRALKRQAEKLSERYGKGAAARVIRAAALLVGGNSDG